MGTITDMDKKTEQVSTTTTREKPNAGVAMDRAIEKKKNPVKMILMGVAGLALAAAIYYVIDDASAGRTFKVNENRLIISNVTSGTFEDFIPVRGRVTPLKTVFLDAVAGGRVEKILIEDGVLLEMDQPIIELSNPELQLSVMGNEARVTEQLNNLRKTELDLEKNRLGHKRTLATLDWEIKTLTRKVAREKILSARGSVPVIQYEDTVDDLAYKTTMRDLTRETQLSDIRMQEQQLKFLKSTGARLEISLEVARANLDHLNMTAPVAGKLSGFTLELGQNVSKGERIGQVDDPNYFKLSTPIDEFYLGRVDLGQSATFEKGGTLYSMKIAKIYPDVENGQFKTDLIFTGQQPNDIRRGQTIQTRLTLGDSSKALLIPNGAFYQDTGGSWVFVVGSDGMEAGKREVRLGRRNSRFIEVLEGLELGERVVTSPYTSFKEMDRLKLLVE